MEFQEDPPTWKGFQVRIREALRLRKSVYIYPLRESLDGPVGAGHAGHEGYALEGGADLMAHLGFGDLCSKEVEFEGAQYKLYWVTRPYYQEENLIAQCFGLLGIRGGIILSPLGAFQE